MNDTELARALRSLDPASTVVDDRTEQQIADDLRHIRAAPVARTTRRWPWIAAPSVAAAAAVIAIITGVWSPIGGSESFAATPPLLTLNPTTATLGDVMDRAVSRLRSGDAAEAARHASFEGWYLQTDVEQRSSVVSPQEHRVEWNDDLSGTITITAGNSYPADDTSPGPAPGTILQHEAYLAGQMPILFTTTPPPASGMSAYLAQAMGGELPDASAYLAAIRVLQSEWTLSGDQRAALLEGLRGYAGVEVAGEVTDRLGRAGVALRIHSDASPHYDYLAIIGDDTGALIAIESIYLGGLQELPVAAPSVTEYIAWK